jgi:hypothetical protein
VSVFQRANGSGSPRSTTPRRRMRQVGTYATRKEAQAAEVDATGRHVDRPRAVASFAGRWMRDYPRPKESTNQHNAERVKAFAENTEAAHRLDHRDEARLWALEHPSTSRRCGRCSTTPTAPASSPPTRSRRSG